MVVQAEPARAHVRRVPEVVRVPDAAHVGVLGAAADEPALGGDDQVSAAQLRTAMSITDIAAVTVQYGVAVRLGAAVRQVAQDAGGPEGHQCDGQILNPQSVRPRPVETRPSFVGQLLT